MVSLLKDYNTYTLGESINWSFLIDNGNLNTYNNDISTFINTQEQIFLNNRDSTINTINNNIQTPDYINVKKIISYIVFILKELL